MIKKQFFNCFNDLKKLNLTTILKNIKIKRNTYCWLKVENKIKTKEEKYLLQ
ncbi:hypothetical protein [Aster yellows witches'-broom phytoplasma]|uniref:hypothetical protein n=1 Tax=Aster yellows witches'-broom phytoplasma TaxID=229545 RepID=UPI0002F6204F